MSFGHSGAVRFESNPLNGNPGIFWQKGHSKAEKRKFGYKSKNLRHEIRQPDNSDLIATLERKKEEENQKFNRENKDFVNKNKLRFKPKDQAPPPGTTHIAPGTVTLTQEQLAALLSSLGALKGGGKDDNTLRISIDADNNKIEVEREESDTGDDNNSDDDRRNGNDNNNSNVTGNRSPALGIYDLLNGGEITRKQPSSRRKMEEDKRQQKQKNKNKYGRENIDDSVSKSHDSTNTGGGGGGGDMGRSTLVDTKKDAGVGHLSPRVPLKHMTVGERKRLQWALERAELEKDYDPWGRPGAGAPIKKVEENNSNKSSQNEDGPRLSTRERHQVKRMELESEIEKIRKEIVEAEKKKEEEEQRIIKSILDEKSQKESKVTKAERQSESNINRSVGRRRDESKSDRQRKNHDDLQQRNAAVDAEKQNDKPPDEAEESTYLSKKEMERRKWVAELDKQREEQRMKKQLERERDKHGVQDQWADRFVYHKTQLQTSPRRGQGQSNPRDTEVAPLGRTVELDNSISNAPPAAMRSSIVIGAGTLNDKRYNTRKEDERKQLLEELDRQREEKRQQLVARKEQERQEDGVWADRYPTDRQKINQFAGAQVSPRVVHNSDRTHAIDDGRFNRVSSAPEPNIGGETLDLRTSQEQPTTFLRGQGVYVDPVTRKEQEEKRRLHVEYQNEIKAQIEEKERLKRLERDRKAREDMEEEKKFQIEREKLMKQEEAEHRKTKDREAQQQKHLADLKTAMANAEERAKEEKILRRMQHLQQRGHDISHLKATYEAITPRIKEFEVAAIPGLGNTGTSPRTLDNDVGITSNTYNMSGTGSNQFMQTETFKPQGHPMGQSYTKDPYVEDRVLTPSRHRAVSKPDGGDLSSPRREFGTQTLELKDIQSILSQLPDDIQIEYKMKVEEALKGKQDRKPPTRKVHSKSADIDNKYTKEMELNEKTTKDPHVLRRRDGSNNRAVSKERQMKVNERPQWNQRKIAPTKKNSEKDPFYRQKKEESEARKAKRERQLHYLQELNKERIPNLSPTRARASSPDQNAGGSNPNGDRGRVAGRRDPTRRAKKDDSRNKNGADSPNILTLANNLSNDHDPAGAKNSYKSGGVAGRGSSPPLPTVKHKTVKHDPHYNDDNDAYLYTNNVLKNSQTDGRYLDHSIDNTIPTHDGEFVPFTRTTEILDPARAGEPMAVSRENSRMERARRAYHETRQPAKQGKPLNVLQDREREAALKASQNNPIMNPQLVTDHPTGRQDQILQQLSSLKQNLMQRRRELENYMSPTELESQQ